MLYKIASIPYTIYIHAFCIIVRTPSEAGMSGSITPGMVTPRSDVMATPGQTPIRDKLNINKDDMTPHNPKVSATSYKRLSIPLTTDLVATNF